METWGAIAVGVLLFLVAVGWVLGRKSRSAVEDFGEPRAVTPVRTAPGPVPVPGPLSDLAKMLVEEASRQTQINLSTDPMAITRITEAANKAQAELRQKSQTAIDLPYIAADARGPKHFAIKISRDRTGRVSLHP